MLARVVDYLDSLLADKYTRHVSIEVMRHAAGLDLAAYEDPVFYDRLERARVQATDRLGMIQSLGRPLATGCHHAVLVDFDRLLFSLAVAASYGWSCPRVSGRESLCIFGVRQEFPPDADSPSPRLSANSGRQQGSGKGAEAVSASASFLTGRFTELSDDIYRENVELSGRKLRIGALLTVLGTLGYYVAYAWVIWRTVHGELSIGTLYFLSGAILQASNNIQQIFSTASSIADQALFLTDLLAFFAMQPTIRSKPHALPAPRPIIRGFEFRNVSFTYPGHNAAGAGPA